MKKNKSIRNDLIDERARELLTVGERVTLVDEAGPIARGIVVGTSVCPFNGDLTYFIAFDDGTRSRHERKDLRKVGTR